MSIDPDWTCPILPTNEVNKIVLVASSYMYEGQRARPLVKRSYEVALALHRGQMRFGGDPYIRHLTSVLNILISNYNETTEACCAALLHDILEDVPGLTPERLREVFFSPLIEFSEEDKKTFERILATVQVLTKRENEAYLPYIQRVSQDPIATMVKLSDLRHNHSDQTKKDKREKYELAIQLLLSGPFELHPITS